MIVQYDSDGAVGGIPRVEVGQETNEFDTAVTVLHARRDVAVLEIQCGQDRTGAQSLVLVIAADLGVLARNGRQVASSDVSGLLPGGAQWAAAVI